MTFYTNKYTRTLRLAFIFLSYNALIPPSSSATLVPLQTLVTLDPQILQEAKNKVEPKEKKILQKAINQMAKGLPLLPEAETILNQLIGPIPDEARRDLRMLQTYVLQKLEIGNNVHYDTTKEIYHEILNKPIDIPTPPSQAHHLKVTVQPGKKVQDAVDQAVEEQYKAQIETQEIPFSQLLISRCSVSPEIAQSFIEVFIKFYEADKAYTTYKHRALDLDEDPSKRKSLRKARKNAYREAKKFAFLYLNIPFETLEYLLEEEEIIIKTNPQSGIKDIFVPVDVSSQTQVKSYQRYLSVHNESEGKPETQGNQTVKALYGNNELAVKNYALKQQTAYTLHGYAHKFEDEETGELFYHVYYRAFNKEKNSYDYYLYTPEDIEAISESEFFVESYSPHLDTLTYVMTGVHPMKATHALIPSPILTPLKHMISGIFCTIFTFVYIDQDKGLLSYFMEWWYKVPYKRPVQIRGNIKGGGLYNFTDVMGNVCWFNSATQAIKLGMPNLMLNTTENEVNAAAQELFDKMDQGWANPSSSQGASEQDIHEFRQVLHTKTNLWPITNTRQQDASEYLGKYDEIARTTCYQSKTIEEFSSLEGLTIDFVKLDTGTNEGQFKATLNHNLFTNNGNTEAMNNVFLPFGDNHQLPEITMEALVANASAEEIVGRINIPAETIRDALAIDQNNENWKKAMQGIQTYFLHKKSEKLQTQLTQSQAVIKNTATTFAYGKNVPEQLEIKPFYENILKEDLNYDDNLDPNKLTEKLFSADKLNERSLCLNIIDFYQKTAAGKEQLMAMGTEEALDNIFNGFTALGFGIGSKENLKALLNNDATTPFDIDDNGAPQIKYKRKRTTHTIVRENQENIRVTAKRFHVSRGQPAIKVTTKIKQATTIQFPTSFDNLGNKATFSLQAFIVHIGAYGSGHYVSYGKKDGQWYKFNDETVSSVAENQIEVIAEDGYIFFYRKVPTN